MVGTTLPPNAFQFLRSPRTQRSMDIAIEPQTTIRLTAVGAGCPTTNVVRLAGQRRGISL